MVVDEGDPYSALLINKSINRLRARGIFGKVEKKITEGSTPNLKVLEITIEEKATGELAAGAGVGTDGTSVMFSVSENNWLGRGIEFGLAAELTEETISGNLSVNNPNYNYSGNAVFSSLTLSSADKTTSSGYKNSKTGFSLGTEFEQYENIFLAPSISGAHERIEVQSTASTAMQKMDGNFTNLDFSYAITLDKRNQVFQPTSGYRTRFTQKLPLILDSSSLLNGLDVSTYHGFSDDVVGAVKFYARTIHGLNDEDVRVTSRLYAPMKNLRGFKTSRVGPKDGTDWIGGNYVTTLGFEALMPTLLPEATKTDISLFLDTGNVWSVDYSNSLDGANKIRSSVGIAANVFTVVGPLSFVFAQDLTKYDTDETEAFNFRIGTSF